MTYIASTSDDRNYLANRVGQRVKLSGIVLDIRENRILLDKISVHDRSVMLFDHVNLLTRTGIGGFEWIESNNVGQRFNFEGEVYAYKKPGSKKVYYGIGKVSDDVRLSATASQPKVWAR